METACRKAVEENRLRVGQTMADDLERIINNWISAGKIALESHGEGLYLVVERMGWLMMRKKQKIKKSNTLSENTPFVITILDYLRNTLYISTLLFSSVLITEHPVFCNTPV